MVSTESLEFEQIYGCKVARPISQEGARYQVNHMLKKAEQLKDQIVRWRRELHQIPELGLELPKTSNYIAQKMKEWGIPTEVGAANSGVVSLIEGSSAGEKTIAIRADMDGLPVQEKTGLPYTSRHEGQMHACGHDAHVAMALGAARLLIDMNSELSGQVKMIFQPGEEGPGGAEPMIQDGVLSSPDVDRIIGLHIGVISDEVKNGQIGIRSGPAMASSDSFSIEITGKGGHGAIPHTTVDPIAISAAVVQQMQSLISRELSPTRPGVLSVCQINGGTANNIIPEKVSMKGTARFINEEERDHIAGRLIELTETIGKARGADIHCDYERGYPVLLNDTEFTQFFNRCAADVVGEKNVVNLLEPIMGAEDMAYFLREVPGTYFFLGGAKLTEEEPMPHHHPCFDVDEDVLPAGTALLAETALRWLKENG